MIRDEEIEYRMDLKRQRNKYKAKNFNQNSENSDDWEEYWISFLSLVGVTCLFRSIPRSDQHDA